MNDITPGNVAITAAYYSMCAPYGGSLKMKKRTKRKEKKEKKKGEREEKERKKEERKGYNFS
jgi:ribosomal protein L12E/L44/L45/RPP1/RPP2